MRRPARRRGEAGFTLTELLVSVVILGIVGAAITQAIIVSLRTTDGSVARTSGAIASETLTSYFSADAQSAAEVADPTDAACASTDPAGVFLRLRWSDGGAARTAEYTLEPPTGGEQNLVRWFCVGGEPTPGRRVLGHFVHDASAPSPVVASCDDAACPATPGGPPDKVSLLIRVDESPPNEVTVRRRAVG